jgi:hypothetical protein
MIQLWIGLAAGTIMLAVIALLVWRERGLRRQLAEYRELLSRAAEGRNIHQDADAERFKRSQYFARTAVGMARSIRRLAKWNAVEGVSAAQATRRHVLGLQVGIDDLQMVLFIDVQATEVARLAQSDDVLALIFPNGNHPEQWIGMIEARHRFTENPIPMATHPGQQEPEQRRVIQPVSFAWMH